MEAVVASSILLSAGTYLFDFGSNLIVLVQYSQHFTRLSRREAAGASSCDANCRHQTSDLTGYFYALLGILVCCHTLNAVLFKLKFRHGDAPVWAAYFLPLIHLYRLSKLLWHTFSCVGVGSLRSPEMNGLYCILGSAMEGVPMLILQFCGYLVLTQEGNFVHTMFDTFKVSVAASLVSAAYSGGTSVQSITTNAITLRQKIGAGIIGGGFTLCAALMRCLTFTNIIVYIREYFSQQRTLRDQARFHVSDSLPPLFIAGSIIAYFLHFWLLHSPKYMLQNLQNLPRLLSSLSFSYMSMILGPLYPMISLAVDAHELGRRIFHHKLLGICLIHALLDLVLLCTTRLLGTLPTRYLIVSALATAGYLGFLIAYIQFDASCGPEKGSSGSSGGPGDAGGRAADEADNVGVAEDGDVELEERSTDTGTSTGADARRESRQVISSCLSMDRRRDTQRGRRPWIVTACCSMDRDPRLAILIASNDTFT